MNISQTNILKIPVIDANTENTKPYGHLLGDDVSKPGNQLKALIVHKGDFRESTRR